jgi:tetratricopeptide (TPR) repeat protein
VVHDAERSFEAVLGSIADGDLEKARRLIAGLQSDFDDSAPTSIRSRAARVTATAHRLVGDYAAAEERLGEAFGLAAAPTNDDPLVAVEAELELGDLRRAQGRDHESEAAYDRAGRLADDAAMPQAVRWKIALRSIDHDLKVDPARGVARLMDFSGSVPEVSEEAISAVPASMQALVRALDPVAAGDVERALVALEVAATEARKSEDVPVYVAARIAIAQLCDQIDDRPGAYRSLASGWATLRAAIGPAEARDAFEPIMLDFQNRWGPEEFVAAKSMVEQRAAGT